jgi:hypothetical protein
VNEVGYLPAQPKRAMVGFYLGSLGEMKLESSGTNGPRFQLVEAESGREVFQGPLRPRPDKGFPDRAYLDVLEADFTAFTQPGEYRVQVAGLGASFPFFIDDGVAAAFARTYALGLYHQRCGAVNELPFTRFVHAPCHVAPAEVPTMAGRFASANEILAKYAEEGKDTEQDAVEERRRQPVSLRQSGQGGRQPRTS